jgi:hypothetical protein
VNQRTARLIRRLAFLHHLRDPREVKQPVASVEADLKKAWNNTNPAKREETRRALVAIAHDLIGDQRG